jgi:hypothetical protein
LPYRSCQVGLRVCCSVGKDDLAFVLHMDYAEEFHQGEVLVVSTILASENEAHKVVGVFALECKQQTSLGRHPALPREGVKVQWLSMSGMLVFRNVSTHLYDIRHHHRHWDLRNENDEQLDIQKVQQQSNREVASRAPGEIDGERP